MAGIFALRPFEKFDLHSPLCVTGLIIKGLVALVIAAVFINCFSGFDFAGFFAFVRRPFTLKVIRNSFSISFRAALYSSAVGLVLALMFSSSDFALKRVLLRIMRIPFVLPSIIIIVALTSVFGVSGMIKGASGFLYSKGGIVLAHSYYSLPVVFFSVLSALGQRKFDMEESFMTLGASRFLSFVLITFPSILKTLALSFMLSFISAFSSFTIVVTFGGMKTSNIESEIYKSFSIGDAGAYSGFCLLSLMFSLVFAACSMRIQRTQRTEGRSMAVRPMRRASMPTRLMLDAVAALASAVVMVPLLTVFFSAFMRGGSFSFANFSSMLRFFGTILKSMAFSGFISVISVAIVVLLAAYARRTGDANVGILFAGALSSMLLSSSLARFPGLSLSVAHVFMTVPFSYYLVKGEYDVMRQSMLESARLVTGNEFLCVFYVELSNLRHVVANASVFSFALSFCDVSSTLLLSRGRFYTASMLLHQAVSHYDFNMACAIAVVMAVAVMLFYAIVRFVLSKSYG